MKTYNTRVRRAIGLGLGLGLMLLFLGATGSRLSANQFVPILEWLTLQQVNEREVTAVLEYELNTTESQVRLLGAFYSNYPQSYSPAVDSTRGVVYLPETPYGPWSSAGTGGSIAVIDLKTLAVQRRLFVEHNGVQVTPSDVSLDPVANRLFVGDFLARRLYIVDATSGVVQAMYERPYRFSAYPYSRTTNRLYLTNYETDRFAVAALDLADLGAEPSPLQKPPVSEQSAESYFVVNDDAKVAYWGFIPENKVFAYDIDPASPGFHQIIWSTTGSAVSAGRLYWLQPTVDRARGLLYVPDVLAGVIRVFNGRRGPSLHEELAPIPIADYLPAFPDDAAGAMVTPEVDPVTGLLYALFTTNSASYSQRAAVITIDPTVGVVGRASLPDSVGSSPGPYIMLDPGSRRILVGTGAWGNVVSVLEDRRAVSMETPASPSGSVSVSAPEASLTFTAVTDGGTTTIRPQFVEELPQSLPGAFSIGGALLYEITTTAVIEGPITLCFRAAHVDDPASFDSLRVLHIESGEWIDRTSSSDFGTRTICAISPSLSPFVIARLTSQMYTLRLLYTTDRAYRRGSTAPLKVQVLDWSGANVSAATLSLRAVSLNRTSSDAALTIEASGNANPDADFRYDADLDGYIFNLSTGGLAPGTYTLTADVGGRGHFIQLPFSIR